MPTSSKRPCSYPGCKRKVKRGRCSKHKGDTSDRLSARQRGYDRSWELFAKAYLAEPENQFCRIRELCNGDFATQVDHIVPLAIAPKRKYDRSNLQPACRACHGWKTARGE